MSLIEAFMSPCILMEKVRIKDGASGFITEWKEGEQFDAAITLDTTMEARIAEKDGVSAVYTVTTYGVKLGHDDIIKRVEDGRYFRITSDGVDKKTPGVASFNISQVNAERLELTT